MLARTNVLVLVFETQMAGLQDTVEKFEGSSEVAWTHKVLVQCCEQPGSAAMVRKPTIRGFMDGARIDSYFEVSFTTGVNLERLVCHV